MAIPSGDENQPLTQAPRLIGIHFQEELKLSNPIVSIDGITLKAFDFIDIGGMLDTSGAVPVVIKSLVFPLSSAVGQGADKEAQFKRVG